MFYEIKNRFTGSVIFSLETESMKLCVEAAVKSKVDLNWANLDGANLNRANLDGASLNWASLNGANLDEANLNWASLNGASLDGASLNGANLDEANLNWASLNGANLDGANLNRANLDGARYGEGISIENTPIQILGTKYLILIMDAHIKIGCKLFSREQWESFTDEEISRMDSDALKWWSEWRDVVLSLSLKHQQRIAAKNNG